VIGGDAVSQQGKNPCVQDVPDGFSLGGGVAEKRRLLDVGRCLVPRVKGIFGGGQGLPFGVSVKNSRIGILIAIRRVECRDFFLDFFKSRPNILTT